MPIIKGAPIREKAALEVGHICFEWAALEDVLGVLMAHLLGLGERSPEAHIVDGNMDIREKIQATKGLAFLRHFDKKWLETTLSLLDHIDNNLRTRRNLVVHAAWFNVGGRSMQARTRKTKLVRPQSFRLELQTEQNLPTKISDLQRLRRDLQETWLGLLPVYWYMLSADGTLISPQTSPTISWRQYLRWAGLGNPLRNVNSVRLRQQRASRAKAKKHPR